jgi:peptidyl-tRNA hydrolase
MAAITNELKAEKTFKIVSNGELKEWACYSLMVSTDFGKWIEGSFAKIVLKAEAAGELKELVAIAKSHNIPTTEIVDSGATQEIDEGNLTIAIGPFDTTQEYGDLNNRLAALKLY